MTIKNKHKISFEQADLLIEKYYEGNTSLEEEKILKTFLQQKKMPEKYQAEQAMFGYFESHKLKPTFKIHSYTYWAGTAAAILILGFGLQNFNRQNTSSFAYVDGKKIEDIKLIKSHALVLMNEIAMNNNELEESIKLLSENDIVAQQLSEFAE